MTGSSNTNNSNRTAGANPGGASPDATGSSSITLPKPELPKGGGAIRGIEEKFQVNAVTGTSSMGIPVPLSPSRQGFAPALGLAYNSANGSSPFGIGWEMTLPRITRKTTKNLPQYRDEEESDTFVFSGAEDLVPKMTEQMDGSWSRDTDSRTEGATDYSVLAYRPRTEGAFARIEKWKNKDTGEVHWRTVSSSNVRAYYGLTSESRIADPADETKVFEWLLCKSHDDTGNICLYTYKEEDFVNVPQKQNERHRVDNCTQTYLKTVYYGNKTPWYIGDADPSTENFLFRVVLDYGEHDTAAAIPKTIDAEKNTWPSRLDPFSTYRAGFEIRTYRRCDRILVFHCFDSPDLPHKPYLVKSLQLFYENELQLTGNGQSAQGFSFLVRARQNGHKWDAGASSYSTKYLPETEFTYQQHEWNSGIKEVSAQNIVNAPVGIGNRNYLWIDLFNEGISGILTEQAGGWFYKSNLGNAAFSEAVQVAPKPSFSGIGNGNVSIQELEGNGIKYLAQLDAEPRGFFKLSPEEEWEPFRTFESMPNIRPGERNVRAIDLNGDGIAELLLADENTFTLYEGKGEKGFVVSTVTQKQIDEEKGPAILFSDAEQSIFLADFSGDGLTDIARIRNGSVCYWPNLGYGRFGAKVEMDNAPFFDHPDSFNPSLLRLADIDGSGTTDIIYLGKNDFRVWMNLNGNEWASDAQIISPFPEVNQLSDVAVLDFLGAGTACIVYSSSLPAHRERPLQYIDLMGSKKPSLLTGCGNNCGKETSIEYRSSVFYYLDDKRDGNKWITKLPFPVHCVARVKSEDKIRETVFVSTYKYRHGYFDHIEGEFRGFARVEQLDTEDFSRFKLNASKNVVDEALHQPPIRSVSWFHTGAFFDKDRVLHQCRSEYFQNPSFTEYTTPEPVLGEGLTVDEWREALRACKSLPLRTESYAEDNTALSKYPYSASESAYTVRLIQPRGENRYASFQVVSAEAVSYGYERNPADPRVNQTFVLETDKYGNSLKVASVVYPRVSRPMGADAIPDKVWDEQNKAHLAYSEATYTNDIISDDVYRLRVTCESKSFEVAGISVTMAAYVNKQTLATQIDGGTEIRYDEDFTGGVQLRLSSHNRKYFINNTIDGGRSLYDLSPLGIVYKSYQLAFTKQLVSKYYGTKVTDVMLADAKYVHSEGDEHWWTQSGIAIYAASPESNFYMPVKSKDVFNNESRVVYDSYMLMCESASDAMDNTISVENDYRVLSPWLMTDVNLNRATVETDELGMVIKTAVMGKAGGSDGDTLDDPTTRLEYDLFNWKINGKPNYAHTFAREKHGASNPRWQESYVYSDGSGGIIMVKSQVEPGEALKWNTTTKLLDTITADPRWLGNGRTIVNNKGKVVKQYDPYFSTTHDYESEDALVETGFSPLHYYDPAGRNVKTEFPNGTFTKVEFDTWKFKAYDVNDTVKDSQWYIDHGSPDPLVIAEPVGDEEKRVAWLAAKHHGTPRVTHTDSMGRAFYSIADYGDGKTTATYSEKDVTDRHSFSYDQLNRKVAEQYLSLNGMIMYRKTEEKGSRWIFRDVLGRLVKRWDNDLYEARMTFDSLHRIQGHYVKEKGKADVAISYVVYGDVLPDAAAKNAKGHVLILCDQSGITRTEKIDFKGNAVEGYRQLANDYEGVIDWSGLEGLTDISAIEPVIASKVNAESFSSSSEVDALNRPLTVVLPDNSVLRPTYNLGNRLDKLEIQVRGAGGFTTFLEEQDYDAKGQRQYAKLGNGLITKYFYDPKTFRLINLITKTPGAADTDSVQNLNYIFDPAGNITFAEDLAQQTFFFKNAVVKPQSQFAYDAVYQLTFASGREHAGAGSGQPVDSDLPYHTAIPHVNDATAVREYKEYYEYDDCGNIQLFDHKATGGNWKRFYHYEYEDDATNKTNRLKKTSAPADPETGPYTANYSYDTHGNMLSMPHLSSLTWNFTDQLRCVDLGGGGKAYYVYGSSGNRVRKIIDRGGGLIQERIYLGAVEIFRQYQGTDKRLERYTLHVADNAGRIAQIDTKQIDTHGLDPANPLGTDVIRYQYSNHLGSATLETNESGDVISYEEYHPFGTSAYRSAKSGTNLSLKRYRFTGKERDEETGLYCFGARYLVPWLGRWTSTDPAGFVDGLNLYRYCRNNPVMLHDPNGCDPTPPPSRFTLGVSAERQADLQDYTPASGLRIETDVENSTHRLNGHLYRFEGHLDIVNGRWFYSATRWTEVDASGATLGSGAIPGATPGDGFNPPPRPPAAPSDGGGTRTEGPPGGSADGDSRGRRTEGPPGGRPTGSGRGTGDDGSFHFSGGSFLSGFLKGLAVGFGIAALILLAPITLPASVVIGAAVVGGAALAYGTVQSLRRRDFMNRPISNEQANENLGFGIGSVVGGAAAGPTINGARGAASGARALVAEAADSFGGQLVPVGPPVPGGAVAAPAILTPAGARAGAVGAAIPQALAMMSNNGEGGNGDDDPSSREHYVLEDAAEAAFGRGTRVTSQGQDIGPVKNADIRRALETLHHNPDDFRSMLYDVRTPQGQYKVMNVFESDYGVYFGPHESSATWQ